MRKVVAVALVDGKKVLMQQRDDKSGVIMPGRWCLPGGMLEAGETLEAAIKREFLEETGYELKNPILFETDSYIVKDQKVKGYIFYEVYDRKQKIKCLEGQKMDFKSTEELEKIKVVPHHDEFGKKAISLFC